MTFLSGFLLALAGMCCFAVSQSKQAKLLLPGALSPRQQRVARWLGWGLLAICTLVGVDAYGAGVGIATVFAWVCIASWLIALTLTRRRTIAQRR